MERIARFLESKGNDGARAMVVCEARGGKEDQELELAFRRVCDGENFKGERYPYEIAIADKKCNSEGLQIADLTARPIGLSCIKPQQANRAYEMLKPKFYAAPDGGIVGWGRKVFP